MRHCCCWAVEDFCCITILYDPLFTGSQSTDPPPIPPLKKKKEKKKSNLPRILHFPSPADEQLLVPDRILRMLKISGLFNFFAYIREQMLFTFKGVHHAVADKFICKRTMNETWERNIPESPLKGIFFKRFFIFSQLSSRWFELMLSLT